MCFWGFRLGTTTSVFGARDHEGSSTQIEKMARGRTISALIFHKSFLFMINFEQQGAASPSYIESIESDSPSIALWQNVWDLSTKKCTFWYY